MRVITNGHECEDAVRQIIQLFFNINDDITAFSAFESCLGGFCTKAAVVLQDGRKGTGEYSVNTAASKRGVSDAVKKSVFSACRQLSDIPAPWGISTGIRPAKTARQMIDDGFGDSEILEYMKNELWISDKKARLALEVAKNEEKLLSDKLPRSVSLYIGIPFCPTRCAYCSFVSQAIGFNKKFIQPYAEALGREIKKCGELVKKLNLTVETLYLGGGTPTSVSPDVLDGILQTAAREFDLSALREFTVEAGRPDTFSEEMLDVLEKNGVDRISINPQTMHDKTLELIGRKHTAADTVHAFDMARRRSAFSINAELIAGLPGETAADFRESLNRVIELCPDAVTVHTMYLKRAARLIDEFERYRFTNVTAEMTDYASEALHAAGFSPYYMYKQKNTLGNLENVGYAKQGHESLYNIYIMEEVQSIFAMGGGASSKIVMGDRIERIFNPKEAADYTRRIDEIIEKKNIIEDYLR